MHLETFSKHALRRFLAPVVATLLFAGHIFAATFQVVNTSDSGAGSFRQALLNANDLLGVDTITFKINGSGVRTITPSAPLPAIVDPVVIDGTTQPGYVDRPLIEINGANAGPNAGLRIFSGNTTIRGLMVNRCGGDGIHIEGAGTNVIQGNYIGVDAAGTTRRANGQEGILVVDSWENVIGGTGQGARNLVSGNQNTGVYLLNGGNNTVLGNYIGTTISGAVRLGNGNNGIVIYNSRSNLVGGQLTAAGNLVSGNSASGIYLYGPSARGNLIQGNYIGVNAAGTTVLSNTADGITVSSAPANIIGGTNSSTANIISGNGLAGLFISGSGAVQNAVLGNRIGSDAAGSTAVANNLAGIVLNSATNNYIGGIDPGAGNLISGNRQDGVYLTNSSGNLVQGNWIGTDASGTQSLPNGFSGVTIRNAHSNIVGGISASARNLLSANQFYGVHLLDFAFGNSVLGNQIGTDANGARALGNQHSGIRVESAGNTIGGSAQGAGNVISGNKEDGVALVGVAASNNVVAGNVIGTTASGLAALRNLRAGVGISGAPLNLVTSNLISGNTDAGIYLVSSNSIGNRIQANRIGTDITGTYSLSNLLEGIILERAVSNTIGGSLPGMGNLVAGNRTRGIFLTNASGNTIQGNWIGLQADGNSPLGNRFHGVECEAGANGNRIGGSVPGEGNRIAFSQTVYTGVRIRANAVGNAILGNEIFSNGALGIDLGAAGILPNDACDADTGANRQQNFPVINIAMSSVGSFIRGTVNSTAQGSFLLQFFASSASDPAGNGEGAIYLGEKAVLVGSDCNGAFEIVLPGSVPAGYAVTATATDRDGNTSEFSKDLMVAPTPVLLASISQTGLTLSWPADGIPYVVKRAASLGSPMAWNTVTTAPVLTNGRYSITLPLEDANGFFVLGFEEVASIPVLEISRSQGGLTLSWQAVSTPLILKSTSSLSSPIQWMSVTNMPVLSNGHYSVELPIEGQGRFFTLAVE